MRSSVQGPVVRIYVSILLNRMRISDQERSIQRNLTLTETGQDDYIRLLSVFGLIMILSTSVDKLYHGEFDPGSERTLAARFKHASRTGSEVLAPW